MIIIGNKIAIVVEFKTLKIVNMKFPERYLVCEISWMVYEISWKICEIIWKSFKNILNYIKLKVSKLFKDKKELKSYEILMKYYKKFGEKHF